MNEDLKQIALTVFGILFAKVVDVAWERREEVRKKKTPRKPGKRSKRS